MMLALISGPASLLCVFLAYLCYRKAHYRHMLILSMVAIFMLIFTIGILAAGYLMGVAINAEMGAM